ncbi:MAG: PEP-CTERM sorting domain-containing protein [Sedimenticola sp.]
MQLKASGYPAEKTNMEKGSFKSILSVLLLAPLSLAAAPVVIDFDDVAVGTEITTQYSGVSFSLLGSPPITGPRTYALDDADGTNVNIFGATGNAITPGDVIGGFPGNPLYDFEISFDAPIDYFSLMAIDAEETVAAYGYLGDTLVQSISQGVLVGNYGGSPVGGYFRGSVYNLELGGIGGSYLFDRVVIDLVQGDHPAAGPELYDNLVYNSVPEPGTLALLFLGIASFYFVRVRHHSVV